MTFEQKITEAISEIERIFGRYEPDMPVGSFGGRMYECILIAHLNSNLGEDERRELISSIESAVKRMHEQRDAFLANFFNS